MNITELIKIMPKEYEKACYENKAITRKRTIKSPKELLILVIFYLFDNHSLIDVCQFALMRNIGKISDVAFMERFIKCKDWIKWLKEKIMPNEIINYKKPLELEPYNVIAVDASDITQKGAVKKLWHLHYAIDLFTLNCHQFKITEQSTGETLKNFEINEKDLIIGDRAYASLSGIEYCLDNGGNFILRIKNKAFNLYDENKEKIILTDWLKKIKKDVSELTVYIKGSKNNYIKARICAVKKTKEEIIIEEKRLKRNDVRRQIKTSEETKFSHNYIFVITSLPETISAEKILEFYRLRWQIEILFKRYKSILGMGSIPTKTKEASETWLNGKMLIALLIEKYLGDIDFSPSWKLRKESEHMERNEVSISFDFY